jgi:hypothetical protein
MATFRVDDLKSKLPGGGARANLFKVSVTFPYGGSTEQTSFMCKAASLPGSVIGQIDVPFRGRQLKVAGDRTFENWNMTILNDNAFDVRDSFETWMNKMNEHDNGTGVLNPKDYQQTITVEQLDRQNNPVKTIEIIGAFPVNLSAIDLAYETTDAIEEFTVEFAYQYWKTNTTT